MTRGNKVDLAGPLKKIYPLFNPETISHTNEMLNDCRQQGNLLETLIEKWFWTPNSGTYHNVMVGPVQLYITRRKTNSIFNNMPESALQLAVPENRNHFVKDEDLDRILLSGDDEVLKLDTSKLGLKEMKDREDVYSYFEINSEYYETTLNPEQRKAAEWLCGPSTDFVENMKMLNSAGIKTVRFWTLNPDYVRKHAQKGKAIVRIGRISITEDSTETYLKVAVSDWNIGMPGMYLRGALKEQKI